MSAEVRKPCPSCPWRISTPPGGFPGGCIDAHALLDMVKGHRMQAMQCHSTPDGEDARVCVGFSISVGEETIGFRLATLLGRIPETFEADGALHSLAEVIRVHGRREYRGRK